MVQFSSFSVLHKEFRDCFTSKVYQRNTRKISRDSNQRKFPHQLLKGISWDICFKLLPSSPKPLFYCFYIKTQLNSSVFHSINISKVIFNSFHWFWSLDYVFGSFMFIVEIFSNGSWKTYFLSFFLIGLCLKWSFALDVGLLWHK